jgi:hypothetical protein
VVAFGFTVEGVLFTVLAVGGTPPCPTATELALIPGLGVTGTAFGILELGTPPIARLRWAKLGMLSKPSRNPHTSIFFILILR